MKVKKLNIVYFSATNTTKKVARAIAKGIEANKKEEFNLTHAQAVSNIEMDTDDLLIVAMPSYSGRVPQLAIESINYLRGNNTPAILACVYGNREYDDTLIELRDIVHSRGFKSISAGAFIAQHSIFPKVATGRPNAEDLDGAKTFGEKSIKCLDALSNLATLPELKVSGNYPYRPTGKVPLKPTGNKKCTDCGTCVKLCPTNAIDANNPRKTDGDKCIACGHCITVCPEDARGYRSFIYKLASKKFTKANSQRKENQYIFVE